MPEKIALADRPLMAQFEALLAAACQCAAAPAMDRVPRFLSLLSDALDCDGYLVRNASGTCSEHNTNTNRRFIGGASGQQSSNFDKHHNCTAISVDVINGGCPLIGATAPHGDIVLYRHRRDRQFTLLQAELLGAIWRTCGAVCFSSAAPEVPLPTQMSPRNRQVLNLLLDGLGEKQIALQLQISAHTVHVYVKNVYRQFNVSSRSQLLAQCFNRSAPRQEGTNRNKNCDPLAAVAD